MNALQFLYILIFSIFLSFPVFAQEPKQVNFTGRILDRQSKEVISGVSIRSSASGRKVISDGDGYFTFGLSITPDTIFFEHLGYISNQLIINSSESDLVIFMDKSEYFIDVVDVQTGYQSLKPNEVTGAVQMIDQRLFNQHVGPSILDRINHVVPGILFDSAPIQNPGLQKLNFSIRGLSTIAAHRDPLIVLDGFIYEGDLSNIDPHHIESVTILKDAAATSIWGARAGNGVLVLTSKQLRPTAETNVNVSFNSTITVSEKPNLRQQYQLSNYSFIEIEKLLFDKGHYNSILNNRPYTPVTPAIEIFHERRKGLISSADSALAIEQLLSVDGVGDYERLFYSTPILNQHSLNIQGGHKFMSYNFGVGYTTGKGELNQQDEKITLNLSNTFKLSDRLSLKVHSVFTDWFARSGKTSFEFLKINGKSIPYMRFLDENGDPLTFDIGYRMSYMKDYMSDYLLDYGYYPLNDYNYSKSHDRINEWYTTAELNMKLLPFLNLSLSGQHQNQRSTSATLHKEESHYARTMINQFSSINEQTGIVNYVVPKGGIKSTSTSLQNSFTIRGQANIRHRWANNQIVGVVGGETRESKKAGESFTVYGYNELPLRSVAVDYKNRYPIIPEGGLGSITGFPRYTALTNRFISLYSNFIYLFQEKYALSTSLRRDGANIFGATTNNKWKPFWSVGTSWDVKQEQWFDDSLVKDLKLRVTYGYSGNVDLSKTALPIASAIVEPITNYPALVIGTLNDPTLRWEQVWTWNVGLDFSVFSEKISGTFDMYNKTGRDLYGLTGYDYTVWGQSARITKNVGSMRSWGTDLSLRAKILENNLLWSSTLNLSTNKNKTIQYYQTNTAGATSFLNDGSSITPVIGLPLHGLSAYTWMGLDEFGNPMGYLDGKASTDYNGIRNAAYDFQDESGVIIFVGSSKPQIYGSLSNYFHYGPWGISFTFSYKGDYYFRKPVTRHSSLFTSGTAFPDFENRWQKPGDERLTDVPSLVYPANSLRDAMYTNSEIHIRKADHVAFEYINLSYISNFQIKKLSRPVEIYANFQNIGLLWTANVEGLHPSYPYDVRPVRNFSFGLRTIF